LISFLGFRGETPSKLSDTSDLSTFRKKNLNRKNRGFDKIKRKSWVEMDRKRVFEAKLCPMMSFETDSQLNTSFFPNCCQV